MTTTDYERGLEAMRRIQCEVPDCKGPGWGFIQARAFACSVVGALLNATGRVDLLLLGYVLWTVGNVLWIALAWHWRRWGMLALFVFYLAMCGKGLLAWGQ